MELQNYISENSDYDKTLKENGFVVKNFNKYNLKLIKYPYDKNINTNTFEKYLKGCIVDTKTNKVVMVPPIKSDSLINYNMNVEGAVIQELFDGTMINLFYHNDQWLHSTRSDINLNNKWSKKSFKKMFEEGDFVVGPRAKFGARAMGYVSKVDNATLMMEDETIAA